MKTLVISAIIAMTSLVNVVSAAAVNRTDNFAYNTETNDGRVETQTVFKVENQKFSAAGNRPKSGKIRWLSLKACKASMVSLMSRSVGMNTSISPPWGRVANSSIAATA